MEVKIKDKAIIEIVAKLYEGIETNPQIFKVNQKTRNKIYVVNNNAILKVFVGDNADERFRVETNFVMNNQTLIHLPKMAGYSHPKEPINYILYEKINGMSLKSIWDRISDEQRDALVKLLVNELKSLHQKEQSPYDFKTYIMSKINTHMSKIDLENYFSSNEIEEIKTSITKIKDLFSTNPKFATLHGDINLSNIYYDLHNCVLIDYEDSLVAPIDYELSSINRIANYPKTYANKKSECKDEHYQIIKDKILKYDDEYSHIKHLEERLAVYDLEYYLNELTKPLDAKKIRKYAKRASKSALIINKYSNLKFNDIKNESELMQFMEIFITNGWIDKEKNINRGSIENDKYQVMTNDDCIKYGVGTSIEQANLAYDTFRRLGIEVNEYLAKDDSDRLHAFTLFNYKNKWYYFEHTLKKFSGIYSYPSLEEALLSVTDNIKEEFKANSIDIVKTNRIVSGLSYNELLDIIYEYNNEKGLK